MSVRTTASGLAPVGLVLYNDRARKESSVAVTTSLASLLACADAWAREEDRNDDATLTFSSTLAAMPSQVLSYRRR